MEHVMGDWHRAYCGLSAGSQYDASVYAPSSYGTFIWDLQKPVVLDAVRFLGQQRQGLRYLDFACGTARVLAALQPFAGQAVGVDLSASMLARAAEKAPGALLCQGNLLDDPTLVDGPFDIITAFRFFLNADPRARLPALRSLAERLRDHRSLLIFNVHGNWTSLDGVATAFRRQPAAMSFRQIRALTREAGLRIEAWYGFGLMPAWAGAPWLRELARAIDRWGARHQALRTISRDVLVLCRPAHS